jgi:hypothetical protein
VFRDEITGSLGQFRGHKSAAAEHDQFHKNSFMGQMQQFYCTSKWPRKFEFAGPFAGCKLRFSGNMAGRRSIREQNPPSGCRKFKSTG